LNNLSLTFSAEQSSSTVFESIMARGRIRVTRSQPHFRVFFQSASDFFKKPFIFSLTVGDYTGFESDKDLEKNRGVEGEM
jgi:hypothetical protein